MWHKQLTNTNIRNRFRARDAKGMEILTHTQVVNVYIQYGRNRWKAEYSFGILFVIFTTLIRFTISAGQKKRVEDEIYAGIGSGECM